MVSPSLLNVLAISPSLLSAPMVSSISPQCIKTPRLFSCHKMMSPSLLNPRMFSQCINDLSISPQCINVPCSIYQCSLSVPRVSPSLLSVSMVFPSLLNAIAISPSSPQYTDDLPISPRYIKTLWLFSCHKMMSPSLLNPRMFSQCINDLSISPQSINVPCPIYQCSLSASRVSPSLLSVSTVFPSFLNALAISPSSSQYTDDLFHLSSVHWNSVTPLIPQDLSNTELTSSPPTKFSCNSPTILLIPSCIFPGVPMPRQVLLPGGRAPITN